MDKENVLHLHLEYYLVVKINGVIKVTNKGTELDSIITHYIFQSQEDMHNIYSLTCG